MPSTNTNVDALQFFLTTGNADGAGIMQRSQDHSLGGYRSLARFQSLSAVRYSGFPGLRIRHVEGYNGIGIGRLRAVNDGIYQWAAPGEDFGESETLVLGETKTLESSTPNKFIIVERTSALVTRGVESIQLQDSYNNIMGMSNFSQDESTDGERKHRALMVYNAGSLPCEEITAWVHDDYADNVQWGFERLSFDNEGEEANDRIQWIEDEYVVPMDPGGITWYPPGFVGPIGIVPIGHDDEDGGTLDPGEEGGLWIARELTALTPANPRSIGLIVVRFKYAGEYYYIHLRGASRIAAENTAGFCFWWGEGADPYPGLDFNSPDEFFSDDAAAEAYPIQPSEPMELAQVLTPGSWYLRSAFRNQFGIVGSLTDPLIFRVADDLSEDPIPPTGPNLIQARAVSGGSFRIEAQYSPSSDQAGFRATHWILYYTLDGTTPSESNGTEFEQAMAYEPNGPNPGAVLFARNFESDLLEGTPVKILLRTRRKATALPDVDSENTDITETEIEYCGPSRPDGLVSYYRSLVQYTEPYLAEKITVVIDEANNIFVELMAGQTRFWADDILLWNLRYDSVSTALNGWYLPLSIDFTDITDVGSEDSVDVLSWTGADNRLGINVGDVQKMLVDVTNMVVKFNLIDLISEPDGACQAVPFWKKYASTCFMVFDAATNGFVCPMSLSEDGYLNSLVPFMPGLTQEECL